MPLGTLSNIKIDSLCKTCPNYGGCYSKDRLPKQAANKWYIVNLQDSSGGGTHWVLCYNVSPSQCLYMDSYGQVAPPDIEKFMGGTGKDCFYMTHDLQPLATNSCGYWCMWNAHQLDALTSQHPNRSLKSLMTTVLHKYADHPSNLQANELMLQQYFRRKR